jgi:hypothetical protein
LVSQPATQTRPTTQASLILMNVRWTMAAATLSRSKSVRATTQQMVSPRTGTPIRFREFRSWFRPAGSSSARWGDGGGGKEYGRNRGQGLALSCGCSPQQRVLGRHRAQTVGAAGGAFSCVEQRAAQGGLLTPAAGGIQVSHSKVYQIQAMKRNATILKRGVLIHALYGHHPHKRNFMRLGSEVVNFRRGASLHFWRQRWY